MNIQQSKTNYKSFLRNIFKFTPDGQNKIIEMGINDAISNSNDHLEIIEKSLQKRISSKVDLIQSFALVGFENQAKSQIESKIQNSIKSILSDNTLQISDFKIGYKIGADERYEIYLGFVDYKTKQVVDYNYEYALKTTESFYYQNLLSKEEFTKIKDLIVCSGQQPEVRKWVQIHELFQKHKTLRWNPSDIILGHKILANNKTLYLHDLFNQQQTIKMDIITLVPYSQFPNLERFVKVTNWTVIQKENPTEKDLLQFISKRAQVSTLKSFNPLKCLKQLWVIAQNVYRDSAVSQSGKLYAHNLIQSIEQLLDNDLITLLNCVVTDLKTLNVVIEKKLFDTISIIDSFHATLFVFIKIIIEKFKIESFEIKQQQILSIEDVKSVNDKMLNILNPLLNQHVQSFVQSKKLFPIENHAFILLNFMTQQQS